MRGKQLKQFVISETIITLLFILIIWCTFYVMRNVIMLKSVLVIFVVLLVYVPVGALNMVYHLKKSPES